MVPTSVVCWYTLGVFCIEACKYQIDDQRHQHEHNFIQPNEVVRFTFSEWFPRQLCVLAQSQASALNKIRLMHALHPCRHGNFGRYCVHLAWSGHHILLVSDAIGVVAPAPAVAEEALLCQSSFYFGQRSTERGRQSSSRPP